MTGPALGVFLHSVGGFAAGSFYAPLKKIRSWAWESYWLMMGIAAWLVAPWIAAWLTIPELGAVISESLESNRSAVLWAVAFGMLWGFGNLTFGMSVRYLGMALGYAMALGYCMVFGSLVPPIYYGKWGELVGTTSGQMILAGIGMCLAGIALCGVAGVRRERELELRQVDEAGGEQFNIRVGFAVAVLAGALSACFNFGLEAGAPMAEIAVERGAKPIYSTNAVLTAVLVGGFMTNAVTCLLLNFKNRTFGDYVRLDKSYVRNCLLSWLAGVSWFLQFFFYGMGARTLGDEYGSASWAIHMAFIVVFSNLWGIVFHEWRGTKAKTRLLVWIGILILIGSTVVIGYGKGLAGAVSAG